MLRQGLEGISPKKFTPVTTIPGVDTYKIPDRVKRGWDQGGLNRVWISDINYEVIQIFLTKNSVTCRILHRELIPHWPLLGGEAKRKRGARSIVINYSFYI